MLSSAAKTVGCRRLIPAGQTTSYVTRQQRRRFLPMSRYNSDGDGPTPSMMASGCSRRCCRFMTSSQAAAMNSLESNNSLQNSQGGEYFSTPSSSSDFSPTSFSSSSSTGTVSGSSNDGTAMKKSASLLESLITNLETTSKFNQGKGRNPYDESLWDVEFVQSTVDQYEECLQYLHYQHQQGTNTKASTSNQQQQSPLPPSSQHPHDEGTKTILLSLDNTNPSSQVYQQLLLSSETTVHAFRSMLRCKVPTSQLSDRVRTWEKYIGTVGKTPLTDQLSLAMLEANGKAGNIGRVITLLSVRKARNYPPIATEFIHAIQSIEAAGLYLRQDRNIFLSDKEQPSMDNPTRWLDAILLNMRERDYPLSTKLANRMLNTFAATGKSGKAVHYFYRVLRSPIEDEDDDHQEEDVASDQEDDEDEGLELDNSEEDIGSGGRAQFRNRPVKVRLSMRPPPPYHKIPSQVRGKYVLKPGTSIRQLKLERESDPDWSLPLTAAIAFADSLEQGACGHDPIPLDLISYNTLIKACVNRGSLWRAMHLLDDVMPAHGIQPDVITYNTLLTGLSRVGDVPTMKDYFSHMVARDIHPTSQTVQAIVNGMLNLGDVTSAITLVQDCFNQYSILPSYQTHLKILEFALGTGLRYEAKRHVSFIQQLWRWEQNDYHSDKFIRLMDRTKQNPNLSRKALEQLFSYFGEDLEDTDFF